MKEDVKSRLHHSRRKNELASQPPRFEKQLEQRKAGKPAKEQSSKETEDKHNQTEEEVQPSEKKHGLGCEKPTNVLSETQRPSELSGYARGHNVVAGTLHRSRPTLCFDTHPRILCHW